MSADKCTKMFGREKYRGRWIGGYRCCQYRGDPVHDVTRMGAHPDYHPFEAPAHDR